MHMCEKLMWVRSWQSASEWLPDVAAEADSERVIEELAGRPRSVAARTGYLLQGMRPDVAVAIGDTIGRMSKVHFGPRTRSLRNDERWGVVDALLPFDPREMQDVR